MIIKEVNIDYSFWEKFRKNYSVLFVLVLLPFIIILIPLLILLSPLFIFFEFFRNKILYGFIYKLIGKEKKEKIKVNNHLFCIGSTTIEFHFLHESEEAMDILEKKYETKLFDDDLEYIGYFDCSVEIEEINDKYFSPIMYLLGDKLIVQEHVFPDTKSNLGVIDIRKGTYEILRKFDEVFSIHRKEKSENLEIILKFQNYKKSITFQ